MSLARIGARGLPPPPNSEAPSDTPAAAATVRRPGADGLRARGAGGARSAPRAPAGPSPMRPSSRARSSSPDSELAYDDARSGALERDAAGSRFTPAQLYGRQMERLEFRNAQFHRQMMADAGLGGTRADLFGGESRDFESYYARQVASGHTRSYEDHYHFLRPGPVVMPGPSWRG